jgi:hypothetical protein
MPMIICWNLRTSEKKVLPVEESTHGYVMLSGYSSELLKMVLNDKYNTIDAINELLASFEVPDCITTIMLPKPSMTFISILTTRMNKLKHKKTATTGVEIKYHDGTVYDNQPVCDGAWGSYDHYAAWVDVQPTTHDDNPPITHDINHHDETRHDNSCNDSSHDTYADDVFDDVVSVESK